jgi:uncharacterized membrane protein
MIDELETVDRWDKNRVEAFSDGVLAIAITLLVLDINVPENLDHLGSALEHEWPAYLAYVTSFLTIGGVWFSHHMLFSRLRFVDRMMMRINLLLLMVAAFLPFPTKILAESLRSPESTARTAVVMYGTTILVIELILQGFVRYASTRPELGDGRRSRAATSGKAPSTPWWFSLTTVLYVPAIAVGLAGLSKLAAGLYLLLAIRGVLLLDTRRRRPRSSQA